VPSLCSSPVNLAYHGVNGGGVANGGPAVPCSDAVKFDHITMDISWSNGWCTLDMPHWGDCTAHQRRGCLWRLPRAVTFSEASHARSNSQIAFNHFYKRDVEKEGTTYFCPFPTHPFREPHHVPYSPPPWGVSPALPCQGIPLIGVNYAYRVDGPKGGTRATASTPSCSWWTPTPLCWTADAPLGTAARDGALRGTFDFESGAL